MYWPLRACCRLGCKLGLLICVAYEDSLAVADMLQVLSFTPVVAYVCSRAPLDVVLVASLSHFHRF